MWEGYLRVGESSGVRPRAGWGTGGRGLQRRTRHALHILQILRTAQKRTLAVRLPGSVVSSLAPQLMPLAPAACRRAGAGPGRSRAAGQHRPPAFRVPTQNLILACHRCLGAPAPPLAWITTRTPHLSSFLSLAPNTQPCNSLPLLLARGFPLHHPLPPSHPEGTSHSYPSLKTCLRFR